MSKTITSSITAKILWRHEQSDQLGLIINQGGPDYRDNFVFGTGIHAVNEIWENEATVNGTKTYDLHGLIKKEFGKERTINFDNGNIKFIKILNKTDADLAIQIPMENFNNASGNLIIGPSGCTVMTNRTGWSITDFTRNLNIISTESVEHEIVIGGVVE